MKTLGTWSIKNRVAVNLFMMFLLVAGLITLGRMQREMFPQFALDMVHVSVEYPGATPAEVEEGICIKVEEKIKGIEGIRQIYATAYEGLGSVTAELDEDADLQSILDQIKTEVDRIDTFPEEAEKPVVTEIVNRDPAVSVAVYGEVGERNLREVAEKIRDDLTDTPDISLVDLLGVRNYEISIEVSEENLLRYGISFDDVVSAVRSWSVDLPGGVIKTDQGEILVRSKGQLYRGSEFKKVPLLTLPGGSVVYLGQVAQVIDGFEDADLKARFNGQPTAVVQVNRTSEEDVIKISRTVREYLAAHQKDLPPGVKTAIWYNLADMVQDRIDLLLVNGLQGILLVFITLACFLNLNLAFWVAMGIPISFMGAFLVLDSLGATINMISLFGFIMTLGILVDDAIIVGENVYSHYSRGKPPFQAVADGLGEVGWPVLMAVATTIVAFIPLLFITGIMGKFMAVMPQAVIAILVVSLFEALIILPAHLDHALSRGFMRRGRFHERHERLRARIEKGLADFIRRIYTPLLAYVVQNRYFTFAIGIGVLIISWGLVLGGYVPFVFMPKGESNWVIAEIGYPLGTPVEVTEKTIQRLEEKARQVNAELKARFDKTEELITSSSAVVGFIPRRDWKPSESGSHCGQVSIELIPSENRPYLSVNMVINEWRKAVGDIPGIEKLSFYTIEGGPAGSPIEIRLVGRDFDQLKTAADELKQEIKTFPGTFDITDDFKAGKVEKQLHIKEGAKSLGVAMSDIARQVRQAFYGEEALRIQRGRDDVKVMIRYSEKERRRLSSIEDMRIRTRNGEEIPIQEVATIVNGRSYSVIHRTERKRVITVSADLDEDVANASKIVETLDAKFLPDLVSKYPGVSYDLEGQEKRTRESMESIQRGLAFALMGIFVLLAAQFRSYLQPVIIMVAIPFGLIGAIFGHLVMGMPLTIISVFGIVALAGIVVNDSLILIDFINRAHRDGTPVETAVIQSGKDRFRPVLLTSATTIAGLFPLLLERSFQAQFLIPMAVSLCFGLLAATVLTLLYVPALYLIVNDITHGAQKGLQKIFRLPPERRN